jgi:hypothetical protein
MLTILYFSSDCQKKSGLVILDDDDDLIIRMWKSSKFPYGKYIII